MTASRLLSRRGNGMVLAFFVLMMVFASGLSFLSVGSSSLITARNDVLRARALACAEAGVDQAINFILTGGPDGSPIGEWRTVPLGAVHYPDHSGDHWYLGAVATGENYKLCVRDGSGLTSKRIIITSVGWVTQRGVTVFRTVKVIIKYKEENVNVWNNVVFGGVGMYGRSINGNVRMRGSVHLLGDGETFTDVDNDGRWDDDEPYSDTNGNGIYDVGETFADVDGDGHRDSREPFNDVNGNGTRDPALTVTDLAVGESGTADVGNNYNGMPGYHGQAPNPVDLYVKIPPLEKDIFGGESVDTLEAKLRVKHGRVDIQGSACVGYPDDPGPADPSLAVKETMDGTFVSDGFGGQTGVDGVHSDNGYGNGYDLGDDLVKMPNVSDPYMGYPSYMDYLADPYGGGALVISGDQNWDLNTPISKTDGHNSISIDTNGNMTIQGVVLIQGNLTLGTKNKSVPVTYSGKGTLATTGNMAINSHVLPATKFATTGTPGSGEVLGLLARHQVNIGTDGGTSQLELCVAMYGQEKVTIGRQCEIAGTVVSNYFAMNQVPHIYQVPELADNLPPGMPGSDPIYIRSVNVESWQAL